MTKIRNQSLRKQVLARDLGICRCCGFEACEVHHIIPLIKNGEDKIINMISLCYTCHLHAPDTKKEFYDYMKSGGAKTHIIIGKLVEECEKIDNKTNGFVKFHESFILGKKILCSLRSTAQNYMLEKYNLFDSNKIEDIDFSEFEIENHFLCNKQ